MSDKNKGSADFPDPTRTDNFFSDQGTPFFGCNLPAANCDVDRVLFCKTHKNWCNLSGSHLLFELTRPSLQDWRCTELDNRCLD